MICPHCYLETQTEHQSLQDCLEEIKENVSREIACSAALWRTDGKTRYVGEVLRLSRRATQNWKQQDCAQLKGELNASNCKQT